MEQARCSRSPHLPMVPRTVAAGHGHGVGRGEGPPSAGVLMHEVRTPLHALKAGVELLLQGAAGRVSADVLGLLREIATAATELEQATDRLAHLASLWPASPTRLEPVDLAVTLGAAGLPVPGPRPPTPVAVGGRAGASPREVLAEPAMTVAALVAAAALFHRDRNGGPACTLDDRAPPGAVTVRFQGRWAGDPTAGLGALDAELARRTAVLAGAVLEPEPDGVRLTWRRSGRPPSSSEAGGTRDGPCETAGGRP